jgi:transaldolase
VVSVRAIHHYYKAHGIQTVVMGASFRNIGEIEALAGCDRLTISPALLDELAASDGALPRKLGEAGHAKVPPRLRMDEKRFRLALNEDAMATEKLSEGIRGFVKDLRALRALVGARLSA